MKLIYTALSKHNFYYRNLISKFVLEKGCIPLNPFMLFDYYLTETVDRDLVRKANNEIVKRVDEIWVFGEIANGVAREIEIAKELGKPTKYFD